MIHRWDSFYLGDVTVEDDANVMKQSSRNPHCDSYQSFSRSFPEPRCFDHSWPVSLTSLSRYFEIGGCDSYQISYYEPIDSCVSWCMDLLASQVL